MHSYVHSKWIATSYLQYLLHILPINMVLSSCCLPLSRSLPVPVKAEKAAVEAVVVDSVLSPEQTTV